MNLKKCQKCGKNYEHSGLFRNKMKRPMRWWCINCVNEFIKKSEDDPEVKVVENEGNTPLNGIRWDNTKMIIIASLVIILLFAFFLSLKRDYGGRNYYPEERPVDIDFHSIF